MPYQASFNLLDNTIAALKLLISKVFPVEMTQEKKSLAEIGAEQIEGVVMPEVKTKPQHSVEIAEGQTVAKIAAMTDKTRAFQEASTKNVLSLADTGETQEIASMSKKAARYPKLKKIYAKLQKQNTMILDKEQKIKGLEHQMSEAKGIFKWKVRKDLQEQIDKEKKALAVMKNKLQEILTPNHYKTVKDFMRDYNTSKQEYDKFKKSTIRPKTAELRKEPPRKRSILDRLEENKQKVKERENNRQRTITNYRDNGAR